MLALSMSPPIAHYPAVQKRPKLSLQTSQLPITYGTSSRGLSTIATPTAAITPTTLNTFNNTYDLTHRPSPTSTTASPSISRQPSIRDRPSRSQSPRPKTSDVAYAVNLPYGIKPILKNTPFPQLRNNSISASPRSSTRRVFFPAPKQVCFRAIIEEDIVNRLYTARHYDLFQHEQQQTPLVMDAESDESESKDTEVTEVGSLGSISISKRRKCQRDIEDPHLATKSSSSAYETNSETTETTETTATPIADRKQRRWEWTLAPVSKTAVQEEGSEAISKPVSTSEASTEKPISSSLCASRTASAAGLKRGQDDRQDSAAPNSEARSSSSYARMTVAQPRSQQPRCSPLLSTKPPVNPAMPPYSNSLRPTTSPLCSPSAQGQRRASSLDSSPRKRKAECLDPSALRTKLVVRVDCHCDSDSGGTCSVTSCACANSGQSGVKRRERAATL